LRQGPVPNEPLGDVEERHPAGAQHAHQLRLHVLEHNQREDEIEVCLPEQTQIRRGVVMKAHTFAVVVELSSALDHQRRQINRIARVEALGQCPRQPSDAEAEDQRATRFDRRAAVCKHLEYVVDMSAAAPEELLQVPVPHTAMLGRVGENRPQRIPLSRRRSNAV
jgi:hypothetical protein